MMCHVNERLLCVFAITAVSHDLLLWRSKETLLSHDVNRGSACAVSELLFVGGHV
jgi:hypothetical protein